MREDSKLGISGDYLQQSLHGSFHALGDCKLVTSHMHGNRVIDMSKPISTFTSVEYRGLTKTKYTRFTKHYAELFSVDVISRYSSIEGEGDVIKKWIVNIKTTLDNLVRSETIVGAALDNIYAILDDYGIDVIIETNYILVHQDSQQVHRVNTFWTKT